MKNSFESKMNSELRLLAVEIIPDDEHLKEAAKCVNDVCYSCRYQCDCILSF